MQFPITSTTGRLILCAVYAALAVAGLIVNRRHLMTTLTAPFVDHAQRERRQHDGATRQVVSADPVAQE